jgi:DNA-binding transcriptional MerR regulator
MERILRISEVSHELGVSVDWLRQAEGRGRIPKAKRDLTNGWRVYTPGDIAKIRRLLVPGSEQSTDTL